jgi:serine/threonine protein kinase
MLPRTIPDWPMTAASKARSYRAALRKFGAGLGSAWQVEDDQDGCLWWSVFIARDSRHPTQGWKIHISAAASDADDLCQRVLPVLVEFHTSFKIPATLDGFIQINSGMAGESQIGKIVTVYPQSEGIAAEIAREIDAMWPQTAGPSVASELAVRRDGAVYLRYGAFGGGQRIITHNGMEYAIVAPDGKFESDDRSRPFPQWAPTLPLICVQPEKTDFMREIAFAHRKYLPVVLLHSSPKAKLFYGIATDDASEVAIKIVGSRTCEDLRGFNAGRKVAREFAILAELRKLVPGLAPSPLDFREAEHCVLVETAIEGTAVQDLSPRERVRALPLLASTVAQLHAVGYVHRDLKLCHAVQTAERICLIDFELAARIGATDFPLGGTQGYVPPESDDVPVSTASDVYSLGACIAHAILDYDPASLPPGPGRLVGLLRLKGARQASHLVKTLTRPDPLQRPSASVVAGMLSESRDRLTTEMECVADQKHPSRRRRARRAAIEAALATREYSVLKAEGRSWTNTHLESNFESEGINLGAAGIMLGLMSLDEALGVRCFEHEVFQGASKLAHDEAPIGSCGLFTGSAGVALALTVCGLRLRHRWLVDSARDRLCAAVSNCRDLDLFSGAAGIVWTGCLMGDILAENWPLETVRPLVSKLLTAASYKNGFPSWPGAASAWKEDEILTGAAHGGSGIAMALGAWGGQRSDERATSMALAAFQGLYRAARTSDGSSLTLALGGVPTEPRLWCNGAAGYLWCVLHAFGDCSELREEIDWVVRIMSSVPPIGGITYCHGVCGQIELWRMLCSVDRYRTLATNRVNVLNDVLLVLRQRRNGLTVWCSEDPAVITPDLWVGFLGPATAIALSLINCEHSLLSSSWLRIVAKAEAALCE